MRKCTCPSPSNQSDCPDRTADGMCDADDLPPLPTSMDVQKEIDKSNLDKLVDAAAESQQYERDSRFVDY